MRASSASSPPRCSARPRRSRNSSSKRCPRARRAPPRPRPTGSVHSRLPRQRRGPPPPAELAPPHLDPALERVGIPYFRSYDLRHTCATLLLYEGRTLNEAAEHLGHADPGFTAQTYTHVMRDASKRRGIKISEAIRKARATASRRPLSPEAGESHYVSSAKSLENERADARTRTGDTFITSVDQVSPRVAPSRAKPHESRESAPPRWRPKTTNGERVDPA